MTGGAAALDSLRLMVHHIWINGWTIWSLAALEPARGHPHR
jgi:hypothetical protein